MIGISMQTALLICSFCFLLGFVFIFIHSFYEKTESLPYFLSFFLLASFGSLLILFRVEIGNYFISIILANSLLFISYIVLLYGVSKLLDQRVALRYSLATLLVFVILFWYFTYQQFDAVVRVIVYNVSVLLIMSRIIYGLLLFRRKNKNNKEMMLVSMILISFLHILRVVFILVNGESQFTFLQFQKDSLSVTAIGISHLLLIGGILSLINNKINSSLVENERFQGNLISNLPGFVYRCKNDENWTMDYLSDGFEEITGYSVDDVIGNKVYSYNDIISPDYRDDLFDGIKTAVLNRTNFVYEYKIRTKSGQKLWVWERAVMIFDEHNLCTHIEGFITDIDTRKTLEENLEFLSYRDSLTGLYNRRFIEEQFHRISQSRKIPVSIIVADINGLKFVNDSFGHLHGDKVIRAFADILLSKVRTEAYSARLSGDEFLVILEETSEVECKIIVERIRKAMREDESTELELSVAIGFATKMNLEESLEDIRKIAEVKMYEEKITAKPSNRRKAVDAVLRTLFVKDDLSESHSQSVSQLSKMLARKIGLDETLVRQVETAGLLHDVGKIIIDDAVLKSKGNLSKEQYNVIKEHPEIGYRILSSVPELSEIAKIILAHHERIDGTGYPNGIGGEEIPLLSRIIAVCDSYDAMVSYRHYKKAMTKEAALKELIRNKGTQFDEYLVDHFIDLIENPEIK